MSVLKKAISPDAPIGVFDSGLGGLTVVRELRRRLPNERIVYFGDVARLPYGIKSEKQIRDFSLENTEFLLRSRIKALVVACHSSSSAAFSFLKARYSLPLVDVVSPAAWEAARLTSNRRIGVMATSATVSSRAYERAVARADKRISVFSKACPLLVPFVEEGMVSGHLIQMVLTRYLAPLLAHKIDTLILGCTHYPMLRRAIRRVVGQKVKLIDSAPATVRQLKQILQEQNILRRSARGKPLQVFVSDLPRNFLLIGTRFLGEPLDNVKVVRFKAEVTVNGRWTL